MNHHRHGRFVDRALPSRLVQFLKTLRLIVYYYDV